MHGLRTHAERLPARVTLTRLIYGVLTVAAGLGLTRAASLAPLRSHLAVVSLLTVLDVCGYLVTQRLRSRVNYVFDMGIGLGLVAAAIAGPLAAFIVLAVPELVHLGRRRQAFLNLGLVANLVSLAAASVAGVAVLRTVGSGGVAGRLGVLLVAGLAMVIANYVFARLLLSVMRDGEDPGRLIRSELLALLPLEAAAVVTAAFSVVLLPVVGISVLVAFACLAYLPQIAVAQLLRAPSVATLTIDDAAAIYRDALADELALSRGDRRLVHLVDSLVQRRPLAEAPANPLAAMQDALLVTICTERPPTQRHFTATTRSQVILIARRWAELTARCTPALNHREALVELRRSGLAQDAPLALAAAARIIEREDALSEHVAGAPRPHRAPLPRALRHEVLPVALHRLAA